MASINFYKIFTSKLAETYDKDTTDSLPKRIYVTNSTTYSNGTYSYSQALFNNLDSSNSSQISTLINSVNSSANLNEYIPKLIIGMIENIAAKTNTTYYFQNNSLIYEKDA